MRGVYQGALEQERVATGIRNDIPGSVLGENVVFKLRFSLDRLIKYTKRKLLQDVQAGAKFVQTRTNLLNSNSADVRRWRV